MIKTPEDRQAGAEIEVTPEMIEAGVSVLDEFEIYLEGGNLDIVFAAPRLVKRVLEVALEASYETHAGLQLGHKPR